MPNKFISNQVLQDVLKEATDDETLSLTKILNQSAKRVYGYKKLQEEICEAGGHSLVNVFRGQGTGYLDIVDDVADELKIRNRPSYSLEVCYYDEMESLKFSKEEAKDKGIEYVEKYEEKIMIKLLEMIYENLSDEDKKSFDNQINEVVREFESNSTTKLAGTAGLMALGNLGGFATYTFLTSVMSTLSFGALGFGAYTAATSLLSIALGPVGWAALGGYAIFSLGSPDTRKMMMLVATVGTIRQRLKYESQKN